LRKSNKLHILGGQHLLTTLTACNNVNLKSWCFSFRKRS